MVGSAVGVTIEPEENSDTCDRNDWNHWINQPGQPKDTRDRVLADESLVPATFDEDGDVTAGLWRCPYTGRLFTEPSEVDIDHLVPLKEVHESGGHEFTATQKEDYANQPQGSARG